MAVLYLIVLVTDLTNDIAPYPGTTDLVTATLITLVFTMPYFVFAFLLFATADSTIMVAIDMDLLRRNTFHWPKLRWPLYALVVLAVGLILVSNPFLFLQDIPDWANTAYLAFYPIFLVPLAVSAVALALSAVRTLERTIRGFVSFFVAAVVCFNFDFVLYNYVTYFYFTPGLQFADNLVIVAATYFLYLAITSLTPLGKVEPTEPTPAVP